MAFSADSEVHVKAIDDQNWQLLRELQYRGKWKSFTVPIGMDTDFASVPRVFVWLLPQYGRYTKAAILHDWLWRKGVPAKDATLAEADAIFRRAMRELGVPFLRRWLAWGAVRVGALTKPGGRKRWLKDSWQVLPLGVLAVPIVGPPAIFILIALAAFYLLELVFYVPLKAAAALRRRRPEAPPPKQVNEPELGLRLA